MTENLDEIISEGEEERAKRYFKRLWIPGERESSKKRIKGNIISAERRGEDLEEYNGIRDFRTKKMVEHEGVTSRDMDVYAAYRVEARNLGYIVSPFNYDLSEKKFHATVRKINPAPNELTKEEKRELCRLEMSLDTNIHNYICSNPSIEELKKFVDYSKKIVGETPELKELDEVLVENK